MPTAGDYEVEVMWADGNVPRHDLQESIWFGRGLVCKVRLDEFEVCVYVDGDDKIRNIRNSDYYMTATDLESIGIDNDKKLVEALSPDGFLEQINNSWFDLYTAEGEHLDMVSHEVDDAFEGACDYVIEQFVNMCKIENNQMPQVEGKRVVVFDFEE